MRWVSGMRIYGGGMTDPRVRCMFCFAESGDNIVPSKEHLISRPVASAFGIDRTGEFLRTDPDMTDQRWRPLSGIAWKCVCRDCNSGWMNQLEHEMDSVARWATGPDSGVLGEDRNLTLRKWAIKTHLLLCFMEGDASHFGEDAYPQSVFAPFTLAREVYERDDEAILRAAVGIAFSNASADFVYSFGHPKMKQQGPGRWNATVAPASVIMLGPLQLWVITPHLDADIYTPPGVTPCSAEVRPRDLGSLDQPMDVQGIVVDYGKHHDAQAMFQALTDWASQATQDG